MNICTYVVININFTDTLHFHATNGSLRDEDSNGMYVCTNIE